MRTSESIRRVCLVFTILGCVHFILRMYTTFVFVRETHATRKKEAQDLLHSEFCDKSRTFFADCLSAQSEASRVDYFYLHALEETLRMVLEQTYEMLERRTKDAAMSLGIIGCCALAAVLLAGISLERTINNYFERKQMRQLYSEYSSSAPYRMQSSHVIGLHDRPKFD